MPKSKKLLLSLVFLFMPLAILSAFSTSAAGWVTHYLNPGNWKPQYCELHGDRLHLGKAWSTSDFSRYAIRIGNEMPHANRFFIAYSHTKSHPSSTSQWVLYCSTCREIEIGQETGKYPLPRF
ncbi:hypothetical protein EON80_05540 [bacterium]|nr:MAG: hypothetical protein EON80_05540 [bacterium]